MLVLQRSNRAIRRKHYQVEQDKSCCEQRRQSPGRSWRPTSAPPAQRQRSHLYATCLDSDEGIRETGEPIEEHGQTPPTRTERVQLSEYDRVIEKLERIHEVPEHIQEPPIVGRLEVDYFPSPSGRQNTVWHPERRRDPGRSASQANDDECHPEPDTRAKTDPKKRSERGVHAGSEQQPEPMTDPRRRHTDHEQPSDHGYRKIDQQRRWILSEIVRAAIAQSRWTPLGHPPVAHVGRHIALEPA